MKRAMLMLVMLTGCAPTVSRDQCSPALAEEMRRIERDAEAARSEAQAARLEANQTLGFISDHLRSIAIGMDAIATCMQPAPSPPTILPRLYAEPDGKP